MTLYTKFPESGSHPEKKVKLKGCWASGQMKDPETWWSVWCLYLIGRRSTFHKMIFTQHKAFLLQGAYGFCLFCLAHHWGERGALVGNCLPHVSVGGASPPPSLRSVFFFNSSSHMSVAQPQFATVKGFSVCFFFPFSLLSMPDTLLLCPCGIPGVWVTHGASNFHPPPLTPSLSPAGAFLLQPRVPFPQKVLNRAVTEVRRAECWFSYPSQLEK